MIYWNQTFYINLQRESWNCTTGTLFQGEHYKVYNVLWSSDLIAVKWFLTWWWGERSNWVQNKFNMNCECVSLFAYHVSEYKSSFMNAVTSGSFNSIFLYSSIYFITRVWWLCVFSCYATSSDSFLLYGLWPKSSSTAIIDEVPLSIIQPYIWLANRIDDGALHWILTHQSSTSPWAVVISPAHVFLPFQSLSVSFCLLLLLPFFSLSLIFTLLFSHVRLFFYLSLSLSRPLRPLLSHLSNHSTIRISHCLTL